MSKIVNIRYPEIDSEVPITPSKRHLRRAGYAGAMCVAIYLIVQGTRLVLEMRARGIL